MTQITLHGTAVNTNGSLPGVGSTAPEFTLVNANLKDMSLADWEGRKKLLNIVPSLDTPVCAISTKKFNDYAKEHKDTVVLAISADLPFAMARFCGAEGVENVTTLSMMRGKDFARDYGVLQEDGPMAGLTARAVVVIDENDTVVHNELVSELTSEPNYEAALKALG